MSTPLLVLVTAAFVGGAVAVALGLRRAWRDLDGEQHRRIVRDHEDHTER